MAKSYCPRCSEDFEEDELTHCPFCGTALEIYQTESGRIITEPILFGESRYNFEETN